MPSEADSLARSAAQAALGDGEPQSWDRALDRLARAAELGSHSARGQLRALDDLDLAAWLAPHPLQWILREPQILRGQRFLPTPVCDWLIDRARPRLGRALVYDNESGGLAQGDVRSNSSAGFQGEHMDVVMALVQARIAATLKVTAPALEPAQVLHYAPGQLFERHYDFLEPELPAHAAEIALSGQRIVTFLVYLNDGFEGGETEFPAVGLTYKGGRGDAVTFANLDLEGRPDRRTLHAGLPPTSGEKWLLSQWVRGVQ